MSQFCALVAKILFEVIQVGKIQIWGRFKMLHKIFVGIPKTSNTSYDKFPQSSCPNTPELGV